MFIPILIYQLLVLFFTGLLGLPITEVPAPDPHTAEIPTAVTPSRPSLPNQEEPAGPGTLTVADGDIHLPVGTYSGSFELVHTGGGPVEWDWVGDPRVQVAQDKGVLEPGATTVVSFQIDASALESGANLLANCVSFEGGASDIWITATIFTPPTVPQHLTN